jgi:hypothetical protein
MLQMTGSFRSTTPQLFLTLVPIVFLLEFLDASSAIYVFHLPGEKWMTTGANFNIQFCNRTPRVECTATTACHHSFHVIWMNSVFHSAPSFFRSTFRFVWDFQTVIERSEIERRSVSLDTRAFHGKDKRKPRARGGRKQVLGKMPLGRCILAITGSTAGTSRIPVVNALSDGCLVAFH